MREQQKTLFRVDAAQTGALNQKNPDCLGFATSADLCYRMPSCLRDGAGAGAGAGAATQTHVSDTLASARQIDSRAGAAELHL